MDGTKIQLSFCEQWIISFLLKSFFYQIPLTWSKIYKGCPPYPLLKDLQGTELDYITCWLDHFALDENDSPRPIIGYLKEFKEQQNSNLTTFALPPIP